MFISPETVYRYVMISSFLFPVSSLYRPLKGSLATPPSVFSPKDSAHVYIIAAAANMAANNTKYYYSLPTQAPQQQRSGSRRPPLTPSTVSSPCLTTHAPIASRRDSGSGSPTKASALLAKVASHPTSPRGETPATSPLPSPTSRPAEMHSSPLYSPERPAIWRSESARYVRQYRQQGKQPPKFRIGATMYRNLTSLQMVTSAFLTLNASARTKTPTTTSTENTLL